MNELTNYLNNAALPAVNTTDMADALSEFVEESGGAGSNQDFLSFNGMYGQYMLGKDKREVDRNQLYIMDPLSLTAGWVCWKAISKRPVKEHSWFVLDRNAKKVGKDDLEDFGPYGKREGWVQARGFSAVALDASGKEVVFSVNSLSGVNTITDLSSQIRDRAVAGEDSLMVFYWDSEEFTTDKGTAHKPKYEVEAWVSRESANAFLRGEISKDDLLAGKSPKKKK